MVRIKHWLLNVRVSFWMWLWNRYEDERTAPAWLQGNAIGAAYALNDYEHLHDIKHSGHIE